MPERSIQKPSRLWGIAILAFGLSILLFGFVHYKTKKVQDTPSAIVTTKRPLPHLDPVGAYDHDLNLGFKNFKQPFPGIKTIREIPEGYVRPRRKRQHKMKTSEPGALVTLYADFPEQPLDMCITPCNLNMHVSEKYRIIVHKYGFEPQHWWVDTGLWSADKTMEVPLRTNWLETFKEQKICFDKNEARLSEDQDADICKRLPPYMPPQAQKSGHCNMMFNISKTGYPKEVEALSCTDPIFKAAAVNSVRGWYYYPKVENNKFVERTNMRNKLTFRLTNEEGELIPE